MAISTITVVHGIADDLICGSDLDKHQAMGRIENFVSAVRNGSVDCTSAEHSANSVATGTLTCASVLATHTFTINGTTFTGVASGAVNNQFNIGGSDTLTAANIVTAIAASTTALVNRHVTATSAAAVVTIAAKSSGHPGNAITIASGQGTITASGARLTGGTATVVTF